MTYAPPRDRQAADSGPRLEASTRQRPLPPPAPPAPSRRTVTRRRLASDLRNLGLRGGRPVLVHASLSQIGHVRSGAQTVIEALFDVLGPKGTLVTGAGTPENSSNSRAFLQITDGLTQDAVERYRAQMPAFDRRHTPTSVGAIAEALRRWPGAERSAHPQSSFAAVGPEARKLMDGHRINCHLGEDSPLAKLYERDAQILMLGVGYRACSAFHLAEYRYCKRPPRRVYSCVVKKWGNPRWVVYRDVDLDDRDFETIGNHVEGLLEDQGTMLSGTVGRAESRLIPMRSIVDLAAQWLAENRKYRPIAGGQSRTW